ncbi:MAG TPA: hypothetical protein VFU43_01535 [Streptosporangiaceae bacterium]|nr:hypothetical protein [Streptosporangiaceae bacterium]
MRVPRARSASKAAKGAFAEGASRAERETTTIMSEWEARRAASAEPEALCADGGTL